jgi:hypothetical protein
MTDYKLSLHFQKCILKSKLRTTITFVGHVVYNLKQGGPTSSTLRPRIVFPLDTRAKKPLLAVFLKTNSQFSLSLTILIQK